jgi:hypothetical protein
MHEIRLKELVIGVNDHMAEHTHHCDGKHRIQNRKQQHVVDFLLCSVKQYKWLLSNCTTCLCYNCVDYAWCV